MARDPAAVMFLYGVIGVAGYQLAAQGTFGSGPQQWATTTWANFKRGFSARPALPQTGGGGAGQSQSSGTNVGGSPSPQQPAPPQSGQTQPGSTPIVRDNNSPGYPGRASAAVAAFVAQYGLDPSDRTAAWVNYYRQQFSNWPDDDLATGNAIPDELYAYAVSAIGLLG